MERGTLSLSLDPIRVVTHEFRCFEEQGKRQSSPRINNDAGKISWRNRRTRRRSGLTGWRNLGWRALRVSLRFKSSRHEKVFPANEVPGSLRPTAPIYRTVYQLSRGYYASETEIARYSRAGVLDVAGGARRCPRDSTRSKGDEKSCEGRFGAIWSSSELSNYVHAWKWFSFRS